jgi:immune inhibitor A
VNKNIGILFVKNHSKFDNCMMPPSPAVISALKSEFDSSGETDLNKFLKKAGLEPGYNPLGKDDSVRPKTDALKKGIIEMERINVPSFKPVGEVNALVLLIDFEDNVSTMSPNHYLDMLFSKGTFLTGSLRDYYNTISNDKWI